jgi:uncharacterized protein YjbI with pentapeptide repeats
LPSCQYKYKSKFPSEIDFASDEPVINGKFCFFHDKDHYPEHEEEATRRFEEKVKESLSQNKRLECFGYYLPVIINFARLLEGKSFAQPVYFNDATFSKEAYFSGVTFSKEVYFFDATFIEKAYFSRVTFIEKADFSLAKFSKEVAWIDFDATFFKAAYFSGVTFSETAYFSGATFSKGILFPRAKFLAEVFFRWNKFTDITLFIYAIFEQPNKVTFDNSDLSKVSFADSDVTRIRFGDRIRWGGEDEFTIVEEEWLRKAKAEDEHTLENMSLELVLSVYRNLRENYEFRLRYDDAGKFFIKEMELKRRYREVKSENGLEINENKWFRRHFSLNGLYYHLSRYGESISRPAIIGAITIFLSTLFWITQSNPTLEPHFDASLEATGNSTFVGLERLETLLNG